MDPIYCLKQMLGSLLQTAVMPMRSMHTAHTDVGMGDPYARGYLQTVDQCEAEIEMLTSDTIEELLFEAKELCENKAKSLPAYGVRAPDGTWSPGSPFDKGVSDAAHEMAMHIVKFMLKVEMI